MKKGIFAILGVSVLMIGCWDTKISDAELYGNTFIRLNDTYFRTPTTWVSHNLFDSAFHIKLPVYMRKTETVPMKNGCASIIFMHRDSIEGAEYHYGRVGIDYYYHPNGDFFKAQDYVLPSETEMMLAPVVKSALRGGKRVLNYVVPEGEIINGPFYSSHRLQHDLAYAYDAYYRRKGHTKGEGPVSCHIFLMMNKTEAAMFTISFHDKDSVLFANLFNVVKTFKWNYINN